VHTSLPRPSGLFAPTVRVNAVDYWAILGAASRCCQDLTHKPSNVVGRRRRSCGAPFSEAQRLGNSIEIGTSDRLFLVLTAM
jgi:hypothetical protein